MFWAFKLRNWGFLCDFGVFWGIFGVFWLFWGILGVWVLGFWVSEVFLRFVWVWVLRCGFTDLCFLCLFGCVFVVLGAVFGLLAAVSTLGFLLGELLWWVCSFVILCFCDFCAFAEFCAGSHCILGGFPFLFLCGVCIVILWIVCFELGFIALLGVTV